MKQANSTGRANRRSAGMTLIEIVLVVGLLGLLLSLAMPSYQSYLLRGHRVEAIRLVADGGRLPGTSSCPHRRI